MLAHPTGFAEIWYGEIDGAKIELRTDVVARTVTAKEVTAGHRLYGLVNGELLWAYDMAAEGQPLQPHLWATLVRVLTLGHPGVLDFRSAAAAVVALGPERLALVGQVFQVAAGGDPRRAERRRHLLGGPAFAVAEKLSRRGRARDPARPFGTDETVAGCNSRSTSS